MGPSYPGHFGTLEEEWNGTRKTLVETSPIYSDSCPSSDVCALFVVHFTIQVINAMRLSVPPRLSFPQVQVANDSILNSTLITGIVTWFLQPIAAYSIFGMYKW